MADAIGMFQDLAGMVDTTTPTSPPESDEDALRQFEGMVLRMMLKEMRNSMGGEGPFGKEGAMYQEWFDDEITQRIAEGGGLGLSSKLDLSGLEHVAPVSPGEGLRALFPVDGSVSSRFGHRSDPFSGERKSHRGVDIAAAAGSPIQAVRAGTVTFAGDRGGYGNVVVVDHGGGLETRYAHCESVDVQVGDAVRAGAPIATVGSTGRSTGPHLHFEVRQDGQAVDPNQVLTWEGKP